MKIIFQKWWAKDTKCFSIINYRKPWKEVGNRPRINFHTNGAKKRYGDTCLDVQLILGYIIITYTNFNLQERKPDPVKVIWETPLVYDLSNISPIDLSEERSHVELAYLQAERAGMKEG